jgi:hypothetical protein
MVFAFGVQIPEDFEPEIDAFELWSGDTQIGERTPIERELRHLTLDYGADNRLTVRLYNADEYVDECEVDTTAPSDVLELRGGVPETPQEQVVGQYAFDLNRTTGIATLTLTMNAGNAAVFYRLSADGAELLTGALVPIAEPFKYLSLLSFDIAETRVEFFTGAQTSLYTARFEPSTMSLCIPAQ